MAEIPVVYLAGTRAETVFTLQVDDVDVPRIKQHNWHLQIHDTNLYMVRREICPETGRRKKIYMHRWLLGVTDPSVFVDHQDHDGLNNRRSNLRQVDIVQNNQNKVRGFARYAKIVRKA